MLLIPDLKDKNSSSLEDKATDNSLFKIFPEKSVLNTRISLDSLGYNVIVTDSVNLIYYSGNVKSINFDFQIENKALNQVLNISSGSNIKNYFRFKEVPELKAMYFFWEPPIIDKRNYVYNVKVFANALVEIFDINTGRNIQKKLTSSTQFSLVVSYFDNQTGMPYLASQRDTVIMPSALQGNQNNLISNGEIFFDFANKRVNSLITEEWSNKFNIWGINLNNDLGSKPEIKVINFPENNQGSAYIKQITNNSITLAGNTPNFGTSRVIIKFVRKSDKSTVEDEFVVYPIPVIEPSFPSLMFPKQVYRIEPNLPELNNKNFLVKVFTENKILYSAINSNSFNFTPDENLVGKTLYFERYINGALYGKTYSMAVKQYPAPQIARIQNVGTKKVRITVNTFGFVEGNDNYVKDIELQGNGTYSEIIGQSFFNKSNFMFTQIYEIKAKNESIPFEFKIRVQDQRGNWSNFETYP
jgi:hypothetical protein